MLENSPDNNSSDSIIKLAIDLQFSGELKKINDNYYYWDKIKYLSKDKDPVEFWQAIKFFRNLKATKVYFDKNEFKYNITDYIQKSLHLMDLNIGGSLSSNIGIAETDKAKFMVGSIMEEAISSSQMEGANTTRKKAKEIIEKELKPKTKSEQMIINNYITMQHIVQNKNEELTANSLKFIHHLISKNTLNDHKEEGEFRENNDIFIVNHSNSEVVHTPPDSDKIEQLIKELCDFFNNDKGDFIHPVLKGIIIHFMIGWIHPFSDGNGRTARAVFYWYMMKKGYWLIEYLSISRIIKDTKNQYEKAYLYTENDENDLTYFITYHIKAMEKAFQALKDYIGKKQREVFQAAKFMKIPNINERQAQILKILYDDSDRILNTKEIQNRFNISSFTARTDLNNLADMGFLEKIKVNKIKQNFIKSHKFDSECL